jgi:hypothetical protein
MKPEAINALGSWYQDPSVSTRLDPVLDKDGKQTGRAKVVATETFSQQPTKLINGKITKVGPPKVFEAGRVLAEVPYEQKPVKGYHPVEIFSSYPQSPKGSKGEDVHFGSRITEILQRTGGGGRGGGGGGGAMPDIDRLGKNPLNMAKGGFVEKAISNAGNWKFI